MCNRDVFTSESVCRYFQFIIHIKKLGNYTGQGQSQRKLLYYKSFLMYHILDI